jgi:predicted NBD/HSP70 family sugar kinase
VADAHDVVRLVREGDYEAVRLVRRAGRILGDAIASLVSVLNPHYVVLTDTLARCDELILAGVREHVHAQVAPLATRDLQLLTETREPSIGLSGLAFLVAQHVLIQPSVPR